jgi:hypothetical protein
MRFEIALSIGKLSKLADLRLTAPWLLAMALAVTLGGAARGGGHGPAPAADDEAELESDAKIRGIELGQFRIRAYHPVEAQKSTVRFKLYAAVAKEQFAAARQLAESRRHKLRDEIITATRMAPLTVFDESELTNFRRRILVRLRRAVPDLPVDDVYVSDFQLTVKSL